MLCKSQLWRHTINSIDVKLRLLCFHFALRILDFFKDKGSLDVNGKYNSGKLVAFIYFIRCLGLLKDDEFISYVNVKTNKDPLFNIVIIVRKKSFNCTMMLRIKQVHNFVILFRNREMYTCYGGTYLHAAVYFDKPKVVQWFLENGADTKLKTRQGKTALDIAVEKGHRRCEEILLGNPDAVRRYSSCRRLSIQAQE